MPQELALFCHCSSFLLCTPFRDVFKNTMWTAAGKGIMKKDEATFINIHWLKFGLLWKTGKRGGAKEALLGSIFQLCLVEWQASFIIVASGTCRMHQCKKKSATMTTANAPKSCNNVRKHIWGPEQNMWPRQNKLNRLWNLDLQTPLCKMFTPMHPAFPILKGLRVYY